MPKPDPALKKLHGKVAALPEQAPPKNPLIRKILECAKTGDWDNAGFKDMANAMIGNNEPPDHSQLFKTKPMSSQGIDVIEV